MLPQKKGEIPTTFSILLMEGTEFLRAAPSELGLGLLFAYGGACSLLHRSSKEVATTKVQKLDEACVLFKQKQRSRMSVSLTCGIVFRRKTTTRYAGETEKVQLMRRKEEPPMIE